MVIQCSDALPSVINVAENAHISEFHQQAVDGLPICGPKAVISTIRAVLESVKVRVVDYPRFG